MKMRKALLWLISIPLISSQSFNIVEAQIEDKQKKGTPILEAIATGLVVPWSIDFAPDGRIFVTERPGRIRVIEKGELRKEPWAELDVAHVGGVGLMGLAVSPDFARTKNLFVMGTFRAEEGKLINRIIRFAEKDGRGVSATVVVDNLPSARVHGGGELSFGPDGMLYATNGDALNLEGVQDLRSLVGKVLRYRPDGSIPSDNPFPGSPVYALGLRNPQGLDWHPETGALFATEHGPTDYPGEGGRKDQDELNVILRGANYGWPTVSGMHSGDRFINPLVEWTPAIAPAGLAIYKNRRSSWYGNIFIGGMRGQQLRRIVVRRDKSVRTGWRVVEEEELFRQQLGRIRASAFGPDGNLYFASSNNDDDGKELRLARPRDDRIFRLRIIEY